MGKLLGRRKGLTQPRGVGASAWDLGSQEFDLMSQYNSHLKQSVGPNERVQLDLNLSSSWKVEPVPTE